jgi:hypothetical protein
MQARPHPFIGRSAVLRIRSGAGSTSPAVQNLSLSLPDGAGTSTARSSAVWLTLNSAGGALPATLRLTASASGMTAGAYSADVTVSVTGTTNTPLAIPATLVVTASPAIIVTPDIINFTTGNAFPGAPGAPQQNGPQTQTVTAVSTGGVSPFTATLNDSSCPAGTITLSAASGLTPGPLTITANTANVTAACTARPNVTSSGLATATVPINLTVPTFNPGAPVHQAHQ